MEGLGDPDIATVSEVDGTTNIVFRPKELCDACEADSLGYNKKRADGTFYALSDGTPFHYSDFVLPLYWDTTAPAGSKFDIMGHITAPLQILGGGYANILTVPSTIQWSEVNADKLTRDGKRQLDASEWKKSTV